MFLSSHRLLKIFSLIFYRIVFNSNIVLNFCVAFVFSLGKFNFMSLFDVLVLPWCGYSLYELFLERSWKENVSICFHNFVSKWVML